MTRGHTAVIRIDWKLVSCIVLTTDLCAIKIENITNVLWREVLHVFPTSMKSSKGLQKPGWKNSQQCPATKNSVLGSGDIIIRTLCIFPIPFLLVVQRGNEHPSRTALSWKSRLEYHEASEQRDYRTLDHIYSTVATSVWSLCRLKRTCTLLHSITSTPCWIRNAKSPCTSCQYILG
jgi:hypothetical protein